MQANKLSDTERASEIMKIFIQLKDLGLGGSNYEEINKFRGICNNFIREGHNCKGKIPIMGTKRIIIYNFSCESGVHCNLKYDECI